MNLSDVDYHLYIRPKNFQTEAENERLINSLKKAEKQRKRKPKTPRSNI